MPYLGNVPAEAYTNTVKDSFNGDGSTTAFTLSQPSTTNNLRVVVENVIQDPTVAYTVSGTTLTFTSAPPVGTANIYAVHLGPATMTAVPPSEINNATNFTDGITVDKDGAAVITADRASSDGTIIDLQKSGTSVGSIGTVASEVYIGNGDTGLYFASGNNDIRPFNTSTQNSVDNSIDLGRSATRFKDLYLSGGVYVGGTGSANYLDDVESGSWSPSVSNGSFQNVLDAHYIKIGNQVTVWLYAQSISDITTASNFEISNLPFTSSTDVDSVTGTVMLRYLNRSSSEQTNLISYMAQNGTTLRIYAVINNASYAVVRNSDFSNGNIGLRITLTYIAA